MVDGSLHNQAESSNADSSAEKEQPPSRSSKKICLSNLSSSQVPTFQKEYESSFSPPPFTYKELKDAIPPHLFERSTLKSSMYLVANLAGWIALLYAATFIDGPVENETNSILASGLWIAYWIFQGTMGIGLWILAHECGHSAFSPNKYINHAVGFILHSALLVPYFSWQISHSQHHAGTGSLSADQAYVPYQRRKRAESEVSRPRRRKTPLIEAFEESPLRPIFWIFIALVIGWPLHLLTHFAGRRYKEFASHFLPSSPIFKKGQRHLVVASNIGVVIALAVLYKMAMLTSAWAVIKFYGIPLLNVNALLITITLLHHTDVYIPHYEDKDWTFIRGALATVDRDYGWYLNTVMHHINDSHVVHHLFSTMPHYNAVKATPYIKAKLGDYYLEDKTPVPKALWRIVSNCVFVEKSGDALFYRRK